MWSANRSKVQRSRPSGGVEQPTSQVSPRPRHRACASADDRVARDVRPPPSHHPPQTACEPSRLSCQCHALQRNDWGMPSSVMEVDLECASITASWTKSGDLLTGSRIFSSVTEPCSSSRFIQDDTVAAIIKKTSASCWGDQFRAARSSSKAIHSVGA